MKEGRKEWELKSTKWRKEWKSKKKAFYERQNEGRVGEAAEEGGKIMAGEK